LPSYDFAKCYSILFLIGLDPALYQNQRTNTIYENSHEENAIDLDDATRFSGCDT